MKQQPATIRRFRVFIRFTQFEIDLQIRQFHGLKRVKKYQTAKIGVNTGGFNRFSPEYVDTTSHTKFDRILSINATCSHERVLLA